MALWSVTREEGGPLKPGSRLCNRMRLLAVLTVLSLGPFLVGCAGPAPAVTAYAASIERIAERPGDSFSPSKGHKPLTCLYLRISHGSGSPYGQTVRVLVLDVFRPESYGGVGDEVSFGYRGDLPSSGEVDFDSLVGYRIRRAPNGGAGLPR